MSTFKPILSEYRPHGAMQIFQDLASTCYTCTANTIHAYSIKIERS
jgi:hypothetical protein